MKEIKPYCVNGHPLSPEEVLWRSDGSYRCKKCVKITNQKAYHKISGAHADLLFLADKQRDAPELERFWAKVQITDSCWNWGAKLTVYGYGLFKPAGQKKSVFAHRYSYEMHKGKIPDGLIIDHLCRNRACVNPEHLEPVTHAENNARGLRQWRTSGLLDRCKYGHLYTEENTYTSPSGSKQCRECRKFYTMHRRSRLGIQEQPVTD